jgi:hypothetical protein
MADPLTCDRCMSAPASLLLVLAKNARDQGKGLRSGERVLLLRCEACLRGELPVLERGGRVFTVLAVSARLDVLKRIDREAATAAGQE